jgi:murein DD-endopeptidase MepM/ murein hydrolase activator NlpD
MRKIFMVLLTILLTFVFVMPVYSGLTEEQEKLAHYKAELERVKRELSSVNQNVASVVSLLDSLNSETKNIQENIDVIQNKINLLQQEINQKEELISKNKLLIEKKKESIANALNLSYRISQISPVELLFSNNTVISPDDKIVYISYIASSNKQLLDSLSEKTAELEQQEKSLLTAKKNLSTFLSEKKQQEDVLTEEISLKNELLSTLKEKKLTYITQKNMLESEIKLEQQKIEKLIEESRNKDITLKGGLSWPVRGPITSPFGWRINPIWHSREFHPGIDIAVATGTPVRAAAGGIVTYAGWLTGYGNVVIIYHGSDISTLYAHLKRYIVKKGQAVKRGQVIAYSDNTGWSTGPHLHFGVYLGDKPVNPMNYLP